MRTPFHFSQRIGARTAESARSAPGPALAFWNGQEHADSAVRAPHRRRAFTRVELLAVLTAVALLACVALPALGVNASRSRLAECMSNLRQVGMGFHSWAMSNGDKFPWNVPPPVGVNNTSGGSPLSANPFWHFFWASNEMVTPRILVCPSDTAKTSRTASDFGGSPNGGFLNINYQNLALSYLVGLHGNLDYPLEIVSGDRNLRGSRSAACGIVGVPATRLEITDPGVRWTNGVHRFMGNLLFTDGSVRTTTSDSLRSAVVGARGPGGEGSEDFLIPTNPSVIP